MDLYFHLKQFLIDRCDFSRPLLLGLSGGPDSLCLLHQLQRIRKEIPFELHIAHVDHNWREESGDEAAELRQLAEEMRVPFHLHALDPLDMKGNLEAASRDARLKFFEGLCENFGFQAVLLGHHADDQAETILKSLLERGSVLALKGMGKEVCIGRLKIWRPFLLVPKKLILDWLHENGIIAFEDKTNQDPAYLRARFRTKVFPFLKQEFGKNIGQMVCRLGAEAAEMKSYLDLQITPYLDSIAQSNRGVYIDLQGKCPSSRLELKHLLYTFCEREQLFLSHSIMDKLMDMVCKGCADSYLCMGGRRIYIDRQRVFIQSKQSKASMPTQLIKEGEFVFGIWNCKVKIVPSEECAGANTSWKEAWQGSLKAILPLDSSLHLGPPALKAPCAFRRKELGKWWSDEKIPACLRSQFPVIWSADSVYHEFLTGKRVFFISKECLSIELVESERRVC